MDRKRKQTDGKNAMERKRKVDSVKDVRSIILPHS